MKHWIPGAHLEDLLKGVPDQFQWDPATPSPGIPRDRDDPRDWSASDGLLGGVAVTDERSG
jgi:hypothetical protein